MNTSATNTGFSAFYKKQKPYIHIALTVVVILAIRFFVHGEPARPEFLVEQAPVHNFVDIELAETPALNDFLATDDPVQWVYLIGDIATAPFETIKNQADGWTIGWLDPFSAPFENWRPEKDTLFIIPHIHGRTAELRVLLNQARELSGEFNGRLRIIAVTKRKPASSQWLDEMHADLMFPAIKTVGIASSSSGIPLPEVSCAYHSVLAEGASKQHASGLAHHDYYAKYQQCLAQLEKEWGASSDSLYAIPGPRVGFYQQILKMDLNSLNIHLSDIKKDRFGNEVVQRHQLTATDNAWNIRPFQASVAISKIMEQFPRHPNTQIGDAEIGKLWAEPDERFTSINNWKPYWTLFMAGLIDNPSLTQAERKRILEALLAQYDNTDTPTVKAMSWAIMAAASSDTLIDDGLFSEARLALEQVDSRKMHRPMVLAHQLAGYAMLAHQLTRNTAGQPAKQCSGLNDMFNELEDSSALSAVQLETATLEQKLANRQLTHIEVARSRALLSAELINAYVQANCWDEMFKTESVLRMVADAYPNDWPVQYAYAKGLGYAVVAYRESKRMEFAAEAMKQLKAIQAQFPTQFGKN